jgi:hypothetical protein
MVNLGPHIATPRPQPERLFTEQVVRTGGRVFDADVEDAEVVLGRIVLDDRIGVEVRYLGRINREAQSDKVG